MPPAPSRSRSRPRGNKGVRLSQPPRARARSSPLIVYMPLCSFSQLGEIEHAGVAAVDPFAPSPAQRLDLLALQPIGAQPSAPIAVSDRAFSTSPLLGERAARVQALDMAALGAGRRVDDGVDQRRLARLERLADRPGQAGRVGGVIAGAA